MLCLPLSCEGLGSRFIVRAIYSPVPEQGVDLRLFSGRLVKLLIMNVSVVGLVTVAVVTLVPAAP